MSTDGTFDISNLDRLGTSEVAQVQAVISGVECLIELEKALEQGVHIENRVMQVSESLLITVLAYVMHFLNFYFLYKGKTFIFLFSTRILFVLY